MKNITRALFVFLLLIYASHASAQDCILSVGEPYKTDNEKQLDKEQKAYVKALASDEKKLLGQLLNQVFPLLNKNLQDVIAKSCLVINHENQSFTTSLLAYSAEKDPLYQYPSQTLFSSKADKDMVDTRIRMNFTEKFIKLLKFAKPEKGEFDVAAVGYAGSFIVREAYLAFLFKNKPVQNLMKNGRQIKEITSSEMSNVITSHAEKIRYEEEAIKQQQAFVDKYKNDILDWSEKISKNHPEFFDEVTLKFITDKNSEQVCSFLIVDPIFFDGQYKPAEIVRSLIVNINGYSPKDLSDELHKEGKNKIQTLQNEWKKYINDSSQSGLLQGFVMDGRLQPFIDRYNQALNNLPETLK